MRKYQTSLVFASLLLLGVPAKTQGVKFGLQATIAKPLGDLDTSLDGKLGYGLGVHCLIDLGGGNALAPRLDMTSYKSSDSTIWNNGKFTVFSLGADYDLFINGKTNDGLFFLVGVGLSSVDATHSSHAIIDPNPIPDSKDAKMNPRINVSAGAGFCFSSNFGTELRYNYMKYAGWSTPSLQASLLIRF